MTVWVEKGRGKYYTLLTTQRTQQQRCLRKTDFFIPCDKAKNGTLNAQFSGLQMGQIKLEYHWEMRQKTILA